ncbi:MAG: thioredoxin-dependent thiol peroxidase [Candidatus Kerfeldbacteria bacterium]|nr:thioredoxin-dependent thiol peroxidase [Candidatus Kerfeldbacteria bacterium]
MLPAPGTKAPAFSLPDQHSKLHTLTGYRGQWVLLYFYPKDMTPGCTVEACTIRDMYADFKKQRCVVLGVSTDPVARHKKFADKEELPFTLLADETKKAVKAYGVWGEKKFLGKTYLGTRRTSFLIDPNGTVAKVYEKVKPALHAREVLDDLSELQG